MQRGGKIIQFSAEHFAKYDNIERAPGANITQFEVGYSSDIYALVQRAISAKVTQEHQEEAAAVPGINMQSTAVMRAMDIVGLSVERAAATLATTAANYSNTHNFALAGASQWSHADSTPAKYLEGKKELIAEAIGREPNIIIAGPEVCRALKITPMSSTASNTPKG